MDKNIIKALEENADKETAKNIMAMTDKGERIAKQGDYDMTLKDTTALASLCDESSSNVLEALHLSYLMGLSKAWDISIKNRDRNMESMGYIVSSLMTSIRMRQSAIDAMSMIDEKELYTFRKLAYRFLEVEYDQNQDFMRDLEKVANMLDEMQGYCEQLKQLTERTVLSGPKNIVDYEDKLTRRFADSGQKNIIDTYKR